MEGPGLVANYLRTEEHQEYPNCIEDSNGKLARRNCLAAFCYANRTLWYYLDWKSNDSSTANCQGFIPAEFCLMKISQQDQSLMDWPNMVDCTSLWYRYGSLDTLTHDQTPQKRMKVRHFGFLPTEHTPLKAFNRILNSFSFKKMVFPTIFFEIKETKHPKMSQNNLLELFCKVCSPSFSFPNAQHLQSMSFKDIAWFKSSGLGLGQQTRNEANCLKRKKKTYMCRYPVSQRLSK